MRKTILLGSEAAAARLLDAVFDNAGAGLCLVGPDERIARVNDRWLATVGLGREVVGRSIWDIFPQSPPGLRALHERVRGGETVEVPEHLQIVAGREVWYEGRLSPVRMPDGTGVLITAWDVTARKRGEEALRTVNAQLRESESRFRALADNLPQLAWMADESGSIFWYNRRWYDYTGTTLDAMQGWGWMKVHHPDHLERVVARWKQGLASAEAWEDTFPLRGADGGFRWFLSRANPIRDEQGHVLRWFGTNTDITAERQAQEALREADRRKDQYLAVLSHELRNPLAPILNSVAILEQIGAQTDEARRALDVIQRQAGHLREMVDDLLDVTRIAHGKIELDLQPHDARELVRRTVEDHRALLDERGISLTVEVPPAPLWVRADATRFAQIIANLLQNVAKFSRDGGHAAVALRAAGSFAELQVRDDGVGIPPALLDRVFEPFVQADRSLARVQGGLGLGLALVKALAELHGGTAIARSAGLGHGAELVVTIPLAMEARPVPGDRPARPSPPARRILLIEDNLDAGDTLCELLALRGHDVHLARTGRAGLAMAREIAPELILCDIGLPDLDGYEVARCLRADPAMRTVRLVALTGYALPEDRARACGAGFEAHLAKPPSLERLDELLRTPAAAGAGTCSE